MSRTDAHRPRHVWIQDHPELVVEHHYHYEGVCTLSDAPEDSWAFGHCYRDLPGYIRLCSCPLCSGYFSRRQAITSRRATERACAAAWKKGDEERALALESRALAAERKW